MINERPLLSSLKSSRTRRGFQLDFSRVLFVVVSTSHSTHMAEDSSKFGPPSLSAASILADLEVYSS